MPRLRRIKKEIQKIIGQMFIELNDISNTVILAGTGRSGTTWLQEIINHNNSFRVMFEPFNSSKIKLVKDWNYRQYLRIDNHDPRFIKPANEILNGNVRDPWVDQYNRKHIVHKRLIKDIRANLILKWIKSNFSTIPMILILRHPCAVANSKLKLGWHTHLDDFLVQEDLIIDFLSPFKERLKEAKDNFDKHIFMWCVENYVPLKQFEKGEVFISFYENLCLDPQKATANIFAFLGETPSPEVIGKIKKASAVTRKDSPIKSGESLISSWRRDINERQIERAVEILTLFELHKVYNEGDGPLVSGTEALEIFPP